MHLEARLAAIYLPQDNRHPIHALKYKRHPQSLLTNRTPSATEKNLLRYVCQPVLHVAGVSRITKSNLRGEFRTIWEPFIIPGVVVVNVFAIVGFIFHHAHHSGCDDRLVNTEKSWHIRYGISLAPAPENQPLSNPEPPISGGRLLTEDGAMSVAE